MVEMKLAKDNFLIAEESIRIIKIALEKKEKFGRCNSKRERARKQKARRGSSRQKPIKLILRDSRT